VLPLLTEERVGVRCSTRFSMLMVVHLHYGLAVLLPLLPTPPSGEAVRADLPLETALPASGTPCRAEASAKAGHQGVTIPDGAQLTLLPDSQF
jgi:hypothetical protein